MKTAQIITKNSHLRENLCELLDLGGFKVLAADTNTGAFKEALLHHPDIIICDMMMPETNGIMFWLLIKEERTTHDIPIIFFSSIALPFSLYQLVNHENDIYLNNPFTPEELFEAVDLCLKKADYGFSPPVEDFAVV